MSGDKHRDEFERDMQRLDEMIATIHTREIPPDMLALAEKALASLDARRDEDVGEWAERLAQQAVEMEARDPAAYNAPWGRL